MWKIRFGTELRRRRLAAGISLAQLADLVHYDKGFLSRVERGERTPAVGLVRQCDLVLNAGGLLASLRPTADQLRHQGFEHRPPAAEAGLEPFDAVWDDVRRDRDRLRALARDGLALDHFSFLYQQLRTQGHRTTPLFVYPALTLHASLLHEVQDAAVGTVQMRLRSLLAHYYEYASWLVQELGRDGAARRLIATAERVGATSGADYLVPYAMIRRADLALYRGEARKVVDLAAGAANHPATNHWVRVVADQRQAQGLAMLCERRACEAALTRADRRTTNECPQEDLTAPLGSESTRSASELVRGWCLLDLGQPDQAADALRRGLAAAPAHVLRARALYGARLAIALAAAGQVEDACAQVAGIVRLSVGVDSATARHQLRALHMVLNRWCTRSTVREAQTQLLFALGSG